MIRCNEVIFYTDLKSPLSQNRPNLSSPPVSQAFKQRLKSLAINTLLLYEREGGRGILGVWVTMVTGQKVPCLVTKDKYIILQL